MRSGPAANLTQDARTGATDLAYIASVPPSSMTPPMICCTASQTSSGAPVVTGPAGGIAYDTMNDAITAAALWPGRVTVGTCSYRAL